MKTAADTDSSSMQHQLVNHNHSCKNIKEFNQMTPSRAQDCSRSQFMCFVIIPKVKIIMCSINTNECYFSGYESFE